MFRGQLVGIFIAASAAANPQSLAEAEVLPTGLAGDRYSGGVGTFSAGEAQPGREVTLIEDEAVAAARRDYRLELPAGSLRRNLITSRTPLNHLVGLEFRIGQVVLKGVRLCEPCGHLETLTTNGVRQAFRHRGGLRATVVQGGKIKVGDAIEPVEPPTQGR